MIDQRMRTELDRYRSELLKWTAKVNLIGPEAREHLDAHIAEATVAAFSLVPEGEVLDFGSGQRGCGRLHGGLLVVAAALYQRVPPGSVRHAP